MNALTHTLLALSCMIACWVWGRYFSSKHIIENMLNLLERDGYIKTKLDAEGDKCLVKFEENQ